METGDELPKVMTTKRMAMLVNRSTTTVLAYLGRAEFSHLKPLRIGHRRVYRGITSKDIKTLRALVEGRTNKNCKPDTCIT